MHVSQAVSFVALLAASMAPTSAYAGRGGMPAAPMAGGVDYTLSKRQTDREQVVRRQAHSSRRAAIQARQAAAAVQSSLSGASCVSCRNASPRTNSLADTSRMHSACGGPSSFHLQFSGSGYTEVDGAYGQIVESADVDSYVLSFTTNLTQAATFTLDSSVSTCNLFAPSQNRTADSAFQDPNNKQSPVFLDTQADRDSWGGTAGKCSIANEKLSCNFDGAQEFSVCWSGQVSLKPFT